MGDAELDAIRAARMAQLQGGGGGPDAAAQREQQERMQVLRTLNIPSLPFHLLHQAQSY